jgi:hypothetical protein
MDRGKAGFYCFAIAVALGLGRLLALTWEDCLSSGLTGAGIGAILRDVFPGLRRQYGYSQETYRLYLDQLAGEGND